jgi:phage shock protein PspC (stress-responsive transcriptional regulator)
MLAGVAGGLAEMWGADPSLVRIIWALLVVFTGGIALLVYIVMAIVVPEEDAVFGPGGATASMSTTGDTSNLMRPAGTTGRGGMSPGVVLGGFLVTRKLVDEIDRNGSILVEQFPETAFFQQIPVPAGADERGRALPVVPTKRDNARNSMLQVLRFPVRDINVSSGIGVVCRDIGLFHAGIYVLAARLRKLSRRASKPRCRMMLWNCRW